MGCLALAREEEMEKVSIVMPCYNHARYLKESIEGILGQSYENFEFIIIEDCSTDNSVEIIKSYANLDNRIFAIFHDVNKGAGKSRNDGIDISAGQFIAFCDSDDIWEKDKLKVQISYFRRFPEHGFIHSDSIIIDEKSVPTGRLFSSTYQKGKRLSGDLFCELCIGNFINTQTAIMRRVCLDDGGLFEEGYLEDWIYWVKIAKKHSFLYINEPLARYRVHNESTALNKKGYSLQRIEGYTYLLNNFGCIPRKLRAKMYYLIGSDHLFLGNKNRAKDYFYQSFKLNRLNFKSLYRYAFS